MASLDNKDLWPILNGEYWQCPSCRLRYRPNLKDIPEDERRAAYSEQIRARQYAEARQGTEQSSLETEQSNLEQNQTIWANYPTLRVLKSVFWFAGTLTGIGGSLILVQTGAWPVFISTTISALVLMSIPEILLILIRIERSLASIDSKLKEKE